MFAALYLSALFALSNPAIVEETNAPITVIYPIQDLELRFWIIDETPQIDLPQALQHNNSIRETSKTFSPKAKKDGERILQLIKDNIEPDAWIDGSAKAEYWNGNLIVQAPERIQKEIK